MAYQKPVVKLFEFETRVADSDPKEEGCVPHDCIRIKVRCLLPYYDS